MVSEEDEPEPQTTLHAHTQSMAHARGAQFVVVNQYEVATADDELFATVRVVGRAGGGKRGGAPELSLAATRDVAEPESVAKTSSHVADYDDLGFVFGQQLRVRAVGSRYGHLGRLVDEDHESDRRDAGRSLRHPGKPLRLEFTDSSPFVPAATESDLEDNGEWFGLDEVTSPTGCLIPDAAERAISLVQLDAVVAHVSRRFAGGGAWNVKRLRPGGELCEEETCDATSVTMYDVNAHVIRPATAARLCSFVELVASSPQPPDFYCVHFWGEPIIDVQASLRAHAADRRLQVETTKAGEPNPLFIGARSPRYWVSAFALNQHQLGEEVIDGARRTSFLRAMTHASTRGVVAVVDSRAAAFSRIWCCFELHQAVTTVESPSYVYDVYTASQPQQTAERSAAGTRHAPGDERQAVGITDGLAAADADADDKFGRELQFPLNLLESGLTCECARGEASFAKDKANILAAIGYRNAEMDCTVHGLLAAAALRRALEEGGARAERYLRCVRDGGARKLQLWLLNSRVDNASTVKAVLDALDARRTRDLALSTKLAALPERLGELGGLLSLSLRGCHALLSVPQGVADNLARLVALDLHGCKSLLALPERPEQLRSLTSLNLRGCARLVTLPEGICQLVNLSLLDLGFCSGLIRLPAALGQLINLTTLDLRGCAVKLSPGGERLQLQQQQQRMQSGKASGKSGRLKAFKSFSRKRGAADDGALQAATGATGLTALPDSIAELVCLQTLNLSGCSALKSIPNNLGLLASLTSLDVSGCSGLTALPDLSLLGLQRVVESNAVGTTRAGINLDGVARELADGWEAGGRKEFELP